MAPVEIKEDLFWVGAVDWEIRDFHGYSTNKGSTYNAFLAMDEKIALFDTVKITCRSDLLHNIRKVTDPAKIDYVIVNHVEMDHTGTLPELMELAKPEKVFCSAMGKKAMVDHFHREDWPYEVVKTGDTIRLGKRSVQFIETKMLHWPDNMFSYIPEDRLLISSDAFGQHWATSERFDDEVDESELFMHAAKYYANILLLYSPLVQKLLKSVQEMGLAIDMIAPDHGLIWRSGIKKILETYDRWSRQETQQKALVIYDTMWHSTEMMAKAILSGLIEEGISCRLLNLENTHRSDVMTEVLDAKALIFGSATLNNGMLPRMADMLNYMRGLRPAGRIGAVFGSYGWSGEAAKQMRAVLEETKFQIMEPGLTVKYVPTHEDLRKCVEFGREIGKAVKE